jgi:hypothetical protein
MGGGLFAGAAVGLALLTKSTAYLYIAPFLLAYAVKLLYPSVLHQSMSSRTKLVVATILPIVVLNIPHWTRNYRAFGSPLGCQTAFCAGNLPAIPDVVLKSSFHRHSQRVPLK